MAVSSAVVRRGRIGNDQLMHTPPHETDRPPYAGTSSALGGIWAGIMGVLPHVLHHVGPLAGAALLVGATGKILFATLTFLLTIPLLVRVHRRCSTWRIPAAMLGVFIAVWSISTFVIGPWVNEKLKDPPPASSQPAHEEHHDEKQP